VISLQYNKLKQSAICSHNYAPILRDNKKAMLLKGNCVMPHACLHALTFQLLFALVTLWLLIVPVYT